MGTNSINPNMLTGPVYGLATALPARKLSGTEAAAADALWAPPAPPASVDADNDPSKLYATIEKDGKTIATFYTSGTMVTPNGGPLPANLQVDGHGSGPRRCPDTADAGFGRRNGKLSTKRAVLEFHRECIGALCDSTRRAEGTLARSAQTPADKKHRWYGVPDVRRDDTS